MQSHSPGDSSSSASSCLSSLPSSSHRCLFMPILHILWNKLRVYPCIAHSVVGETDKETKLQFIHPSQILWPSLPLLSPARTVCSPHCSLSQPVKREVRTCQSSARIPPMALHLKGKASVLAVTCKACVIYLPHCLPLSPLNAPFQLHWLPCCFSTCQA